jgi:hypothetical protein
MFATALNLATSLYHFHEWLFDEFKQQLEAEFGETFGTKGAFWQAVEATDTRFGYVRDVTNASKHVNGVGGYGSARYGGAPSVVFDDSGSQISFDDCAQALFAY